MTSGDEDDKELSAIRAALGEPQFPCCPRCREALHITFQDEGIAGEFQPGGFHQRTHLESPMYGSLLILGDREGDCVHCGHHFQVRDSEWLFFEGLSERSRQEVEDTRPLWDRR